MNCPKCDVEMAKVFYESIEVNRCIRCDGLWFDMLGLEHLKAIAGSEEIDVGDPKTGEALNARDRIDGPVRQIQDGQDGGCPTAAHPLRILSACYGVFFDAGESRDYKEETVFDFFRALFAKERT